MYRAFLQPTAVILFVSLIFSNCATIVSKSSYPVSIDTSPEGAQVTITDKKGIEIFKGKTPTVVRLKSGAGFFSRAQYQVKLSAKGYDEQVIPVSFKLNAWYMGNVVFGGLIGLLIVDPISGAMWKIDKGSDAIFATLARSTVSVTEPTLKIMDIKDLPEYLRSSLVRVDNGHR